MYNLFKELLSRVPQGSMLDPILFNIFINDLFHWLSTANLYNFAEDNTTSAFSENLKELIKKTVTRLKCARKWFTNSSMMVNLGRF